MSFLLGPYALSDGRIPVLLAPMSGVTDAPFRKQADKFGATATITEMVAGEDLLQGRKEAVRRLARGHRKNPYVVQLVGRETEPLRAGAEMARIAGADIIDINMGCPSRRVTGGLSGSALMKDLTRAENLIKAVIEGAETVPVTLKMRLGWDWKSLNASELGQIAEGLGVKLLAVHGRTRQDFYNGEANWKAIRSVVDACSIPVICNGDICDETTAKQALRESGAAGVMVGRAATGLAWLPAAIEAAIAENRSLETPSLDTQSRSLFEQAQDCVELYGQRIGMRVIRKHLAAAFDFWITKKDMESEKLRKLKTNACRSENLAALQSILDDVRTLDLEVAA